MDIVFQNSLQIFWMFDHLHFSRPNVVIFYSFQQYVIIWIILYTSVKTISIVIILYPCWIRFYDSYKTTVFFTVVVESVFITIKIDTYEEIIDIVVIPIIKWKKLYPLNGCKITKFQGKYYQPDRFRLSGNKISQKK